MKKLVDFIFLNREFSVLEEFFYFVYDLLNLGFRVMYFL